MRFHPNSITDRKPAYEQVVLAVATERGVEPTDLEPLYETIDPEALDDLFKPGVDGRIEFRYEGQQVVVHSDGTVCLDDADVDIGADSPVELGEDASEIGATEQ